MRPYAASRIAAAMLLVALGACSSESSVAPVTTETPAITLSDVLDGMMIANVSGSVTPMPLDAMFETAITPGNCVYDAMTRRFDCAPQTIGGMLVTSDFRLRDASGALMSSFDATRTATVQTSLVISGEITSNGSDLRVAGSRDLVVGGLLSERRTLDGTSQVTIVGSVVEENVTYPLDLRTRTTFTDLVLSFAKGAPRWPLSGSIAVESTWNGDASQGLPLTYVATIAFSGSSVVVLDTYSAGIARKCTVDLSVPGTPQCP